MIETTLRASCIALAAAGVLASFVPQEAGAGAFGLREQSASGQGMSFAGMAAGGGDSLSGMFWNPAVVNQVATFEVEQNVTGVFPNSDVKATGPAPLNLFGDGGDIGKNAVLASGYGAYRLSDSVAIGLSINTPFGLATDPKHNWGGQLYARSSRVRSVNAAPTVGFKVNEWFSVAAGVQIQYFDIRLRQAVGPAPGDGSATLKGDDVGVGFTAGFTLAPTESTSIGVGFRSSIKHKLDGELTVFPPIPDQDISAKVKLPELVSVGVRQRVTDQLTVLGGVEWTNWSRLGTVNVKNKATGAPATAPLSFDYDDGWFFSGGAEYAYSPDLTLRTGVGYEISPISNDNRTPRLPDDDRWWLSAGGTYNYSRALSFDLGYSYVFVSGKSKIDIAPDPVVGLPGFQGSADNDVHIVSAAIRYKFGGDAPPALVTKY